MDRRDFLKTSIASSLAMSPLAFAADKKPNSQQYQLRGTDVYGKPLDLKDYLGRTVLVSFFTFDCSVCSHDLKLMRDFYLRNVKKKFVLLGVNIDQNKKDLDKLS